MLCRVDKKSELNTNSKRNVNEQTLGSGEILGYSSLVTSPNCDVTMPFHWIVHPKLKLHD